MTPCRHSGGRSPRRNCNGFSITSTILSTVSMLLAPSVGSLFSRDSVAFKVCYAYGLRRREMTMLDLEDFGPNPHVTEYGRFGAVPSAGPKARQVPGPDGEPF